MNNETLETRRENYLDALAIVREFGIPDLFVTMICNPDWREIRENLFSGQQPNDRPDLIVCVFDSKLKAVLEDITKNEVFGKVKSWMYTIEFQKGDGLPQANMLFILEDKVNTAEKIDRYVCAEIPDICNMPILHEIVIRTMIHGPCGIQNPNSPCMENGKCKKDFPKPFNQQTIAEVNGYPMYRRRPGVQVQLGEKMADNSFVIPYNKFLSEKYNCHMKVEACQSLKATVDMLKYMYKY